MTSCVPLSVAHAIRTYGAVAIVGAGMSFAAGLPLTPELQQLLWHAVDTDTDLRAELADELGLPNAPAQRLIGSDPHSVRAAFVGLARRRSARSMFQEGFARLDAKRSRAPSRAHTALAELLHRRSVETVISLNWDTLLERAYRRRYGSTLRADGVWLHKPHGDTADPAGDWVLPHEPGRAPEALIGKMEALVADGPRVLLVIGYSERDEEVVRKLIAPLSDSWKVARMSPHATGDFDVPLPADEALPDLLRLIAPGPETVGWEYVLFDNQHDLGHALAGRKLGPADVEACPRLPEVEAVKRLLHVTRDVTLNGQSGCGKSITAYQAACDLCRQEDWEVIRLVDRNEPVETLASVLENRPRKTIAIVDDAQTLPPHLYDRLLASAPPNIRLMQVLTSDTPRGGDITVSGTRAVEVLADALKGRHDEVLPIVRQFDSRVGDSYLDIPLELRIDEAAQCETPWQFNFVLTSGRQRTRDEIAVLRDHGRVDLLLAAIAAGQIATLDAGATVEAIAGAVAAHKEDKRWLDTSLQLLRERRLVVGDSHLRTPHRRYAGIVLEVVCESRKDPNWPTIVAILRAIAAKPAIPLQGISSLLFTLWLTEGFRFVRDERGVVDDTTWSQLRQRCYSAHTGPERGAALFLLNELRRWHPAVVDNLRDQGSLLTRWLELADAESAWGLGRFLNDCSQDARDVTDGIFASASPQAISTSFARIALSETPAWAWLLDRIAATAPKAWRDELGESLEVKALRDLACTAKPTDIDKVAALIQGIAGLRRDLALQLAEEMLPVIARALNAAPLDSFEALRDVIWFVLGYMPHFLRRRDPSPEQRRVARLLARKLDAVRLGQAISRSKRREWRPYSEILAFLREAAPRDAPLVAAAIDFQILDQATEGLWASFPDELRDLVQMVAFPPDEEPARTWVTRHTAELKHLHMILAIVAPGGVAERIRGGEALDLDVKAGFHWAFAMLAINEIAQVDEALAVRVVEDNCRSIALGLAGPYHDECALIPPFLGMLRRLSPDTFNRTIAQIDPVVAEKRWTERLRGKIAERRAVAALLEAADSVPGPLREVAARLRRRYPAGSRTSQVPDDIVEEE